MLADGVFHTEVIFPIDDTNHMHGLCTGACLVAGLCVTYDTFIHVGWQPPFCQGWGALMISLHISSGYAPVHHCVPSFNDIIQLSGRTPGLGGYVSCTACCALLV